MFAQTVEEINVYEFTYNSKNKKHFWKKREVAIYLLGSFAEDISMFRLRNPTYNLRSLIEQLMVTDFERALMRGYMKGRTLWCASQLSEIIPKDFFELNLAILNLSIRSLIEERLTSVKFVATRCMIKFIRKLIGSHHK